MKYEIEIKLSLYEILLQSLNVPSIWIYRGPYQRCPDPLILISRYTTANISIEICRNLLLCWFSVLIDFLMNFFLTIKWIQLRLYVDLMIYTRKSNVAYWFFDLLWFYWLLFKFELKAKHNYKIKITAKLTVSMRQTIKIISVILSLKMVIIRNKFKIFNLPIFRELNNRDFMLCHRRSINIIFLFFYKINYTVTVFFFNLMTLIKSIQFSQKYILL